jgi:hypothetical protein
MERQEQKAKRAQAPSRIPTDTLMWHGASLEPPAQRRTTAKERQERKAKRAQAPSHIPTDAPMWHGAREVTKDPQLRLMERDELANGQTSW